MRISASLLVLAGMICGCGLVESPVDDGLAATDALPLPDVRDVDFAAAFADALAVAVAVDPRDAWADHEQTLALGSEGCPSFWAGPPEGLDLDAGTGDGWGWADGCAGPAGVRWAGLLYWESELSAFDDGDPDVGLVVSGERRLVGDARVADADGAVLFGLSGELEDHFDLVTAGDYEQWSYASTVAATVQGETSWRADHYVRYTGGEERSFEARGEIHLLDGLLQDRFDSVAMDLRLDDPDHPSADGCSLEADGWLGLRDENAFWYDLVFQPRVDPEGYANDPYGACDAVGTLYLRGEEIGTVALELSDAPWSAGLLIPPDPADFVDDHRLLLAEEP